MADSWLQNHYLAKVATRSVLSLFFLQALNILDPSISRYRVLIFVNLGREGQGCKHQTRIEPWIYRMRIMILHQYTTVLHSDNIIRSKYDPIQVPKP